MKKDLEKTCIKNNDAFLFSSEICTFEFKTDCEKSVTFECSDFDMQPSTGCEKDYLMFILDENTKEGEK